MTNAGFDIKPGVPVSYDVYIREMAEVLDMQDNTQGDKVKLSDLIAQNMIFKTKTGIFTIAGDKLTFMPLINLGQEPLEFTRQ